MSISQKIYNFLYNSLEGSKLGNIPMVEKARRKWVSSLAKGKIITTDYGAALEVDEHDSLSLLRSGGIYEPDTRKFISDALHKHKGVAIDAGANIGYFTVLMSQLANKVYSFEPNDSTRAILERNVKRNNCKNVVLSPSAISSTESTRHLYGDQEWAGANSLISDGRKPIQSVKTNTLDNLITDSDITIIKMDIEGSELDAINGAKSTLARCRYLVVEYNSDIIQKNPSAGKELLKKITDSGFTIDNMHIVDKAGGNLFCHRTA